MPFRGTHDAFTKEMISERLKGHPVSERARQRIRDAKLGKPLTAEHRQAISIGKRRSAELDPERYEAFRTKMSKIRRRLWAEGKYRTRTNTVSRETP